jgi:tetratricopeptide (TPR) repeat protein
MVGLLGMIGVLLSIYNIHWRWFVAGILIVVYLFGFRSALRGLDWNNPTSLSYKDIAASPDDYNAYKDIAYRLILQNKYNSAATYAKRSLSIFRELPTYLDLGTALGHLGNYAGAVSAYDSTVNYPSSNAQYTDEELAELCLVYGNLSADKQFLAETVNAFPNDASLWNYYALFMAEHHITNAYPVLEKAASFPQNPTVVYKGILANKSELIELSNLDTSITIY